VTLAEKSFKRFESAQHRKGEGIMSDEEAKAIVYAVVEWLYDNGKIPEHIYGRMSMDGDGKDGEALRAVVKQAIE
jgi:hypothetical protein